MGPELSPETRTRLERVFAPADWDAAEKMLVDECGNNLPFLEDLDAAGMERFRFAALKVSGGDLATLRQAVDLAKVDWRDLLMWAGFGNDVKAHERWLPDDRIRTTGDGNR